MDLRPGAVHAVLRLVYVLEESGPRVEFREEPMFILRLLTHSIQRSLPAFGQTLDDSFPDVPKPNFVTKYSLELGSASKKRLRKKVAWMKKVRQRLKSENMDEET